MDTEQLFYTQNGYDRADTGPLTTAMEDYLEMICRLTRTSGYTRISALARELHVQPSSASMRPLNRKERARIRKRMDGK